MKSKTSFFNWPISKNLLKRCWPGWVLYLFIVLAMLPMTINGMYKDDTVNVSILNSAEIMVFLSFFVAAAAAMALYSFMYSPKGTGMMASIPVKRETVYSTVFLTGIVPILICNLIAVLIAMPMLRRFTYGTVSALWQWLLITSLANITFFGFASFCATLTGSIWILPLVYAVLSLVVAVVTGCVESVKAILCFGYVQQETSEALVFSPIVYLTQTSTVQYIGDYNADGGYLDPSAFAYNNTAALDIYCAVGLLFAVAGLLIYRRRRMESATDVVAIKCLKPVFKYCMAFGTALVFSLVIYDWLFNNVRMSGRGTAALFLILMLLGGFIGYFAAQMLMDKSVKVFRGNWKGFAAVAAVLILAIAALETDLFRIERNIPEPEQVEKAGIGNYRQDYLSDEDNIQRVVDIQKALVDSKDYIEAVDDSNMTWLYISYIMKDGTTLNRNYPVKYEQDDISDPTTTAGMIQELITSEEYRISRAALNRVDIDSKLSYYSVGVSVYNEDTNKEFDIVVTENELRELYKDCILPDAADGAFDYDDYFPTLIAPVYTKETREYFASLEISLSGDGINGYATPYEYKSYYLTPAAVRTLQWISEHMDISELEIE